MKNIMLMLVLGLPFFSACSSQSATSTTQENLSTILKEKIPMGELGRGINLGNKLDAPQEGDWGPPIKAWMFPAVAKAGFDSVRIPIRWSAHASELSPYTINSEFMARVQWAVDSALAESLITVINMHHYLEIFSNPQEHHEQFLAMWQQIATQFKDYPDDLIFEILNEPNTRLTASVWNEYLVEALAVIRETNPTRKVMIGTAEWGGTSAMRRLQLPDDDNLIFTFHYYNPMSFTHQGTSWISGSNQWLGTRWGSTQDRQAVIDDFDAVLLWAQQHKVPVYLGEFGVYERANSKDRMAWIAFIVSEAEKRGFTWSYWKFDGNFGANFWRVWNRNYKALMNPERYL